MTAINHLAAAHAAAGEVEQACALLAQSVELARHTGDERGLVLARRSRDQHLGRWRTEPAVRRLDEVIRAAR